MHDLFLFLIDMGISILTRGKKNKIERHGGCGWLAGWLVGGLQVIVIFNIIVTNDVNMREKKRIIPLLNTTMFI